MDKEFLGALARIENQLLLLNQIAFAKLVKEGKTVEDVITYRKLIDNIKARMAASLS